jgi:hypothetical protein
MDSGTWTAVGTCALVAIAIFSPVAVLLVKLQNAISGYAVEIRHLNEVIGQLQQTMDRDKDEIDNDVSDIRKQVGRLDRRCGYLSDWITYLKAVNGLVPKTSKQAALPMPEEDQDDNHE